MRYSDNCVKLIKSTRVLYLEKTKLWNSHYYIGYSRLCSINQEKITRKEANKLLIKDLEKISARLDKELPLLLNQNEFDSLVSLIYDIGIKRFITDEMFVVIKRQDYVAASLYFNKFNKYMKKTIYRLIKARKKERELWLKPITEKD